MPLLRRRDVRGHVPRVVRRALVLLLGGAIPVAAQSLPSSDRERGHAMIDAIRSDLERHYYDSTYHGLDLGARFAAAGANVDRATSIDEMLANIAAVVLSLGDSHTLFVPPLRTVEAEYGWDMTMVGDTAIVDSVDRKSDAEKQGVRRGDVVLSINGYQPTRETYAQIEYLYHALRPQPGLRVVMQHPGGAPRQLDLAATIHERARILDLTGNDGGTDFWSLVREAENDADRMRPWYVELGDRAIVWRQRTFELDPDVAKDLLSHARGKQAVVLDLRANGGGEVRTLLAMLGVFYDRDLRVATVRQRRDSSVMTARSVGAKALAAPLVVLVDSRSASAAELFARTVQLTGRGKVVGDRTAGAVMMSNYYGHQIGVSHTVFYGVSVATGAVVLPDGTQLEHVGVAPDVLVRPTSADMAAGRDPALARALSLVGVTMTPEDAGALFSRH